MDREKCRRWPVWLHVLRSCPVLPQPEQRRSGRSLSDPADQIRPITPKMARLPNNRPARDICGSCDTAIGSGACVGTARPCHDAYDRGSSPPGSSRRAGGYSSVLRLTADEMNLPLFPCPKKFTFWDTTLLPRGTFWVRVPRRPARGRPKAVFLLLASCTQEEDAGPAKGAPASVPVTPNYGNPRSRKCPANSAQLPLINYKETND